MEAGKIMNAAFFKNLSDKGRAETLRDIKRKMIAGEMGKHWRHLFFWAPLVVFGEGQYWIYIIGIDRHPD